jgi:hypothetical protein
MRDTPPFMTDEEADDTYNAACAGLFGAKQISPKQQPPPGLRDQPSAAAQSTLDIRHPNHLQHSQALQLRSEMMFSLQHSTNLKEFGREDVPPVTTCATSHAKMTALIRERDLEDHAILVILANITVDALTPQVEARYSARTKRVYAINRALFQAYVEFLTPLETRSNPGSTTTTTEQPPTSSSRGTSSAREVSAAVRQRVHEQQHQTNSSSPDPGQPVRWRWAKVLMTRQGLAQRPLYLVKLNTSSWTQAPPMSYFGRKIPTVYRTSSFRPHASPLRYPISRKRCFFECN